MITNCSIFQQLPNLQCTPQMEDQLKQYYELLLLENKKQNLTRILEFDEVYTKHFFDSLLFTNEMSLSNQKILDLGSGAGFPGLVLKIFFPDLNITLLEANAKKVQFLKLVINQLKLQKIEVIQARAEKWSLSHQENYDLVVSRAVASLPILLEIGAQLVKVGGYFVALKGPKAKEEKILAAKIAANLNFKLTNCQTFENSVLGIRINLFYQKIIPTPSQYPREYRVILKKNQK